MHYIKSLHIPKQLVRTVLNIHTTFIITLPPPKTEKGRERQREMEKEVLFSEIPTHFDKLPFALKF